MRGRVVKGVGGFYYISHNGEVLMGTARGILKRAKASLYVGDIVDFEYVKEDEIVVTGIVERKNFLSRPPVSNLDKLIVTFAAAEPDPNIYVVDKLCAGAESRNIDVIICITKCDLVNDEVLEDLIQRYRNVYPVYPVCSVKGIGIDALMEAIKGSNAALAGASGVGKSTLLNAIVGHDLAETGDISEKRKRGKHTTRHVEVFELANDTNIYDTPGFTSLDIPEVNKSDIPALFPEFRPHRGKCRYSDCMHLKEPGCAVKQAVEDGEISESRYRSYVAMTEEAKTWQK